ncbi:MAG: BrnT family toxin [Bryobacteraceae bacterium]
MEYEWDKKKALQNITKHGVEFADALAVLEDLNALSLTEESVDGEERSVTIGTDVLGRILVVVYTWRENRLRLISARQATPNERCQYIEGL